MDVRPGGSPSGRTDPDHPLDSPEGWRPGNLTRNSPCPANLPKPWPQPVSNSLWRSRYQLYHRGQWVLSTCK